jgi:hypothetical protein
MAGLPNKEYVPSDLSNQRQLSYHFRHAATRLLEELKGCYCDAQAVWPSVLLLNLSILVYFKSLSSLWGFRASIMLESANLGRILKHTLLSLSISTQPLSPRISGRPIESSLKKTLDALFETTEDTCNPDLCIVGSVVAQFEFTLNGEFISYEGNETYSKEGRMMNENQDSSHWQLQDESATNIEGDSDSPSVTTTPSFLSPSSSSPSAAPTLSFEHDDFPECSFVCLRRL